MKLFLLVVSYIVLSIISSLLYVGLVLLLFITLKKVFNMNGQKWRAFFNYKKGLGIASIMVFPFILMIAIMFPVSMFGFELIEFDYKALGYLAVIILPTILLFVKLTKLKENILNQ